MGNGLGGNKLAEMEARIKKFSGATPGSEKYAREFASYNKNPDMYGKVKKTVTAASPVKKAIGGKLGDAAQEFANRKKSIAKNGILGFAWNELTK